MIPKIAYAFASGMGNTGAVCGSVAGAIMAIGLIKDRGKPMEEMLSTLGLAAEFRRRFEAEMGIPGTQYLIAKPGESCF